jgi:hypothetical protein
VITVACARLARWHFSRREPPSPALERELAYARVCIQRPRACVHPAAALLAAHALGARRRACLGCGAGCLLFVAQNAACRVKLTRALDLRIVPSRVNAVGFYSPECEAIPWAVGSNNVSAVVCRKFDAYSEDSRNVYVNVPVYHLYHKFGLQPPRGWETRFAYHPPAATIEPLVIRRGPRGIERFPLASAIDIDAFGVALLQHLAKFRPRMCQLVSPRAMSLAPPGQPIDQTNGIWYAWPLDCSASQTL